MLRLTMMLGGAAQAVPVDDDRAQGMIDALVPEVEAQTGRPFVAVPRVGITNRERLRIRLLRPSGLALGLEGRIATASHEVRQLVEPLVSDALAVYVPYDERIYLVKEAFDELGQSFDLPMDVLEPLLQCVLTHELVHAQQHQYGVENAETPSTQRGQRAIREGHASLVAYRYCEDEHGRGIVRLMETVQGIELEASLDPGDHAAVYGWGLHLASHAVDEEQPRLAKALLDKAPVESSTMMDVVAVRIRAAVALRRWDEVEELIERHPVLPGSVRAYAGSAMFRAGRARGLDIVVAACPDLSGAERASCRRFVERHGPR